MYSVFVHGLLNIQYYIIHAQCMCIQIHCPDDYRNWLGSMFSLFGTKFVKLYSGPMWRVETTLQDQAVPAENKVPIAVCYSNNIVEYIPN